MSCVKDLLISYKKSLKSTRKQKDKLDSQIKELEAFLSERNVSFYDRERTKELLIPLENDKKILSGIISDLEYAIEWMTTARQPGTKRGVDNRRAYYQNEFPLDPSYFEFIEGQKWKETKITKLNKLRIDFVLSFLSEREKEVYILYNRQMYSYSNIADLLKIKKGTVQKIYERADKKIKNILGNMEI